MPDISALYPQPPQPQQNALMQNPLSLATTVSGLQTQALQRQQLQLAITNEMYKAVANGFGTLDQNASADDVNSRAALLSRIYPNAAPIISHFQDRITSNPKLIGHGIAEAAIAANPEKAATPDLLPPDQKTTVQPYGSSAQRLYAGTTAQVPSPSDISTPNLTTPRVAGSPSVPTATYRAPGTTLPLTADSSIKAMQEDQRAEGTFANDVSPIHQAMDLLKQLPPGTTGPGKESWQKFQSFVLSRSPDVAHIMGIDSGEVSNFDQLKKHLAAAAQQRAAQFGAHTDQQAATSLSASPNASVNDLALDQLLAYQLGARRMQNGLVREAAKGGGPDYLATKPDLATHMDVRAFMMDLISPDQRNKLIQGLRGSERANFNRSLQIAYDQGLVTRPPKKQPAGQ